MQNRYYCHSSDDRAGHDRRRAAAEVRRRRARHRRDGGGFMTSRGTANVLTRTTAILAGAFFITSLILSIMAGFDRKPTSILQPAARRRRPCRRAPRRRQRRRRPRINCSGKPSAGRAGAGRAAGAAVAIEQRARAGKPALRLWARVASGEGCFGVARGNRSGNWLNSRYPRYDAQSHSGCDPTVRARRIGRRG